MIFAKENKMLLTLPESKNVFDYKGSKENAKLICGKLGIEMFGPSSVVVNRDWYENAVNNDDTIEETEKDMWFFPKEIFDGELVTEGFIHENVYEDFYKEKYIKDIY